MGGFIRNGFRRAAGLALGCAVLLAAGTATAQVQRPDSPPPDRTEPLLGTPDIPATDLITALDPARLVEIMRELGYDATQTIDNVGDPLISGRMSASGYDLFFYGCTDNRDCTFLLYVAYPDAPADTAEDLMVRWNREKLWGTAFRADDGRPRLSVAINLFGGVSMTNFADTLDWMRVTTAQFEDFLGL